MRGDTLCVVTAFSLHECYCETFDVALRIIRCKATTHPRRPRPLIVMAGANSPKLVTATLHNLLFRALSQLVLSPGPKKKKRLEFPIHDCKSQM